MAVLVAHSGPKTLTLSCDACGGVLTVSACLIEAAAGAATLHSSVCGG